MNKKLLKFMTCGSVDDGKSTLIGRLLYDSNNIYTDQIESLKSVSKKYGTQKEEIDFALLVDGLQSEREQGITIDVAYRYFNTQKRNFILSDTPGHEQYTRNMATAASNVEVSIILINATKGVLSQTKRHTYITTLFGIKNIIVAINKMDLIAYDKNKFDEIKKDFLSTLELLNIKDLNLYFIPICATDGDNIVNKSDNTTWYTDHSILELLEKIEIQEQNNKLLRYPISYVNRPDANFRAYAGNIVNGELSVGDKIKVLPSNKTTTIKEIIIYNDSIKKAKKDEAVTLTLNDEIDINRGDIIIHSDDNSIIIDKFEAMIIWMDEKKLVLNQTYQLNISTNSLNAKITDIEYVKDITTLQNYQKDILTLNDIAKCTIELDKKILIDTYEEIKTMGSFILIDKISFNTSGAGIVLNKLDSIKENIFLQHHSITKELRVKQLNQKPFILYFTGLSSSGKSTLANLIEKELYEKGYKTYLLDGDNLRNSLNSDLGFSPEDREENIRRVAHLSQIMLDAGLIVITAFISPFEKERKYARSLVKTDEFVEIFVDTPIDVCERRDTKGLYKKARNGELKEFTGISSPYERPLNAEIVIQNLSSSKSLKEILYYLEKSSKI